MTYDELLSKVKEKADSAPALGASLKFKFDEDQVIHIDGNDGSNTVTSDDSESDCTINLSMDDFNKLLSKELNPMTAFMMGKVKVDGNMGVAMKMQELVKD